jgi:hypothetical protein
VLDLAVEIGRDPLPGELRRLHLEQAETLVSLGPLARVERGHLPGPSSRSQQPAVAPDGPAAPSSELGDHVRLEDLAPARVLARRLVAVVLVEADLLDVDLER